MTAASAPFSRDFEGLEVGSSIVSPGRTITEGDLLSFSALTGDWHPQHSDATWAAESQFGERIAHGMMVLSYAVGMLPIDPERVVALRGLRQAVFKRPVPIGDTIRVHGEIAETRALDENHGLVTLAVQVRNAEGRLVARASIDAVWRRGEEPDDAAARGGSAGATSEAADPGLEAAGHGPDVGELSPVDEGRVLI